MITTREFKLSDIKSIDDIFNRNPSIGVPSLKNVVVNSTLADKTKVIGYGAVKLYAEATLILDKENLRKRERAQALIEAMKLALSSSKAAGLEYLHIVANDDSFSKVLCKHYGFKEVPGKLLVLDLEEDK